MLTTVPPTPHLDTTIYFGNYLSKHVPMYGRHLHVNEADGHLSNNLEYGKISVLCAEARSTKLIIVTSLPL